MYTNHIQTVARSDMRDSVRICVYVHVEIHSVTD